MLDLKLVLCCERRFSSICFHQTRKLDKYLGAILFKDKMCVFKEIMIKKKKKKIVKKIIS
jgi:hypothetical protein